jgi:alkanesulfonate monooxygenase SsuD/methylene tetrahydromethanopterin reductase-like flavin-dependent oxidoreductase (luciferase family)
MTSPTLETGIVTHPIARDWDRYFEQDMGRGNRYQSDHDLFAEMVSLAVTAEDCGYDFVFAPEHHVSPYGLSVNPLQFMTFLAGRTKRINFGTSIVVLPWWNPLRVAEELALLDNLAPERKKLIGVGRGVAPFEYAALAVPYDDRRERNDEAIEIIRLALTQESFSYEGEVFQIPEVTLRPRPVNADLVDSLLIAATSDETLIEGGRRGLGLIYAGQKSTGLTRADVEMLNRERVDNGFEPTQPVILTWLMCCASEQEAHDRLAQAVSGLLFDLTNNYAQPVWDQFDRSAGYEAFVSGLQAQATESDVKAVERFIDNQIWGTPEQCLEKVRTLQEQTGARNVSFQVQYGDLSHDEAIASLSLFARESIDKLHTIPTDMPDWIREAAGGESVLASS